MKGARATLLGVSPGSGSIARQECTFRALSHLQTGKLYCGVQESVLGGCQNAQGIRVLLKSEKQGFEGRQ